MASSVARMPTDEWRDSARLTAAEVFARPHLRNVLVRNVSLPAANSSSTPDTPRPIPIDVVGASSPAAHEPAVQKRRQSQFPDRWAKEMATTMERKAYKAELSALATRTQPVAARAATFLRETSPASSEPSVRAAARTPAVSCRAPSPTRSDCSFVSAPATLRCSVSGMELPPNVRASSLIQMWRELEAEAGVTPVFRTTSCGSGGVDSFGTNNPSAFPADDSSPGNLDNSEEPEPFADSETTDPAVEISSQNESETSKVGIIVKMLTSGYESTSSSTCPSPSMDEKHRAPPRRKKKPAVPQECTSDCEGSSALPGLPTLRRVRGPKELEDLAMRREQERRREVEALAQSQHVSRFCYRGRLQSMLRLRSLRRQFAVREQMRVSSSFLDINPSNWSTFSLFRQKFEYAAEASDSSNREPESSSCLPVQIPAYSETSGYIQSVETSGYIQSVDEFTGDSVRFTDVQSPRGSESPLNEDNSPALDDAQECFNSSYGSWDERNLWVRNLDWQRNIESSPSNAWQGDITIEESDSCSELNARNRCDTCIGESPDNSWRGWDASRHSKFDESIRSTFSDNVEIQELLEKRAVSTSLASDFSDKMNQIILSFLRRQGSHNLDTNHSGSYNEDQSVWRQSEVDNFDQFESVSSSLVPLTYHTFHQSERRLPNFLTAGQPSQNLTEMDVMHEMRNEMQQIRHDISKLRSMVQGCMQWKEQFQHSMKQDILDAIRQAGCLIIPNENGVDRSLHGSNSSPGRKGNCCICHETKVDSLLYRCGHMCTCYKCACELQLNNSKCPICRSPIVDVVRAYPNT